MLVFSRLIVCSVLIIGCVSAKSLVIVTTTEDPVLGSKEDFGEAESPVILNADFQHDEETTLAIPVEQATTEKVHKPPKIHELNIESTIRSRYSKTIVSSRIGNPDSNAQEATFTVVLPEKAFISDFVLKVGGKTYQAFVKEKEQAKKEYNAAVKQGFTAGHVAVSARDSNTFTINVNVEPESKVTLNLTYEELLSRRRNIYEQAITIDPGQLVKQLNVKACIYETAKITSLKIPAIKTDADNDVSSTTNSIAHIEEISPTSACITYEPSIEQQQEVSKYGVKGQFLIQYDIERELDAGEIYVLDGYFVHFFSPPNLDPLRKHVIFILDTSGSMWGRRMEQLKTSMNTILSDLKEDDYFNIVQFSSGVQHWSPNSQGHERLPRPRFRRDVTEVSTAVPDSGAYKGTVENIAKAKEYVNAMVAEGGTNIHDALAEGLKLVRRNINGEKIEPLVFFLTDGEPTVGLTNTEAIISKISDINGKSQVSIFSLAFGEATDFAFLKKLSLKNFAFARKIYEASDADLQLKGFYSEIASPLLSNVTFHYLEDQVDKKSITKARFGTYFGGSEIVVAGKVKDLTSSNDLTVKVNALSNNGDLVLDRIRYPPQCYLYPQIILDEIEKLGEAATTDAYNGVADDFETTTTSDSTTEQDQQGIVHAAGFLLPYPKCPSIVVTTPKPTEPTTPGQKFVERLWAYLTIKQLLEQDISNENENEDIDDDDDKASLPPIALPVAPIPYQILPPSTDMPNSIESLMGSSSDSSILLESSTSDPPVIHPETHIIQKPKLETPKERALTLALKYGFVTPVTSLVVVKPNQTSSESQKVAVDPTETGAPEAAPDTNPHFFASSGLGNKVSGFGSLNLHKIGFGPNPGSLQQSQYISHSLPSPLGYGGGHQGHYSNALYGAPGFATAGSLQQSQYISQRLPSPLGYGSSPYAVLSQIPLQPDSQFAALSIQRPPPPSRPTAFSTTHRPSLSTTVVPTSASTSEQPILETSPLPNLTLDDITWLLNHLTQERDLMLDINNSTSIYHLGTNQTNEAVGDCEIENTFGNCRHLNYCVQQVILNNYQLYVKEYFCEMPEGYAGICCI